MEWFKIMAWFKRKEQVEYEFLPSALEIQETPPTPLGRLIIWIIFVLILSFFVWACIAKTDKVAVARGKIIPSGRAKVIEPLEEGIVKEIYVREGEKVKEGQLLIKIDPTSTKADYDDLERTLATLKLEYYCYDLNQKHQILSDTKAIYNNPDYNILGHNEVDYCIKLQNSQIDDYDEKVSTQKHVITQRETEFEIEGASLKKLQDRSAVLAKEEKMFKYLADKGSVSKRDWWNKKSELDAVKHEMAIQKLEIEKATFAVYEAKHNLSILEKGWSTTNLSQLVETEKKIKNTEFQLVKAKRRLDLQDMRSPVDGIINQLDVTTVGEVVPPAQAIMTIVPENMPLVADVMVLNRDIGFIQVGQKAELKLDTFPFHKYGIIEGKVINISPDAILNQQTGELVYKVQIKPEQNKLRVEDKYVTLTSGMSLTAEVKTGTRHIIEFFLEPIVKFKGEGLKMR